MSLPDDPFHTTFLEGQRVYWSDQNIVFMEHLGDPIVVQARFLSDGLSIPRPLRGLIAKAPSFLATGVLHDWLYAKQTNTMTRKKCDRIFLWYMKRWGVGWWTRRSIYFAVRIGGKQFFRQRDPSFYKGSHNH